MNVEAVGMNLDGELGSSLSVGPRGRRPSPFAMGLLGSAAVESMPAMAKAATQSGTRNGGKLTQAQIDARAQQRTEDDELIRAAQRGERVAFDSLERCDDHRVLRRPLQIVAYRHDR